MKKIECVKKCKGEEKKEKSFADSIRAICYLCTKNGEVLTMALSFIIESKFALLYNARLLCYRKLVTFVIECSNVRKAKAVAVHA